jgi:hypothetical protein
LLAGSRLTGAVIKARAIHAAAAAIKRTVVLFSFIGLFKQLKICLSPG